MAILIEKKGTFEADTIDFQGVIRDYFYGGEITISFSGAGSKEVVIAGYHEESGRTGVITTGTTTGNSIVFDIDDIVRNLVIAITSENDLVEVDYLITANLETWSNEETMATNAQTVDSNVFFGSTFINTKSFDFKVPNALIKTAESLFENKVYLDDRLYQVTGKSPVEFDIDNWSFPVTLMEVFSG